MRYLRRIFCHFGWHDFQGQISGPMWVAWRCSDCYVVMTVMDPNASLSDIAEAVEAVKNVWPVKKR